MKNVAGFHSFVRGGLGCTLEGSEFRKAFGIIEFHNEGWTTRGKLSVEVAYDRLYWNCERLSDGKK